MNSSSTCTSKLQQVKELLGANTGRHLLLHLASSIAHITISLVLMFFWMNAGSDSGTGSAITFGALSLFYTGFAATQFGTAIAHYYFAPRSQQTLAVTILATSGASTILGGTGIIIVMTMISASSYYYYDEALFVCTMVFLGGSIVMNGLLFAASLFHWRQQKQIEDTLTESIKSPYSTHLYPSHQLERN